MPFFSKSKSKSKSNKSSAQDAISKPAPPLYRHIPTHAASDSKALMPSSHVELDRAALQAAYAQRMSRNSSSQSLAAYASQNSLLQRSKVAGSSPSLPGVSGFPRAPGPSGPSSPAPLGQRSLSTRTIPLAAPRHLSGHQAAWDAFEAQNTVPRAPGSSRAFGKSPLSSPPMSPVDSDASSEGSSSATSLDLKEPQKPTRERHHMRRASSAIKLPVSSNLGSDAPRGTPAWTLGAKSLESYTTTSESSTADSGTANSCPAANTQEPVLEAAPKLSRAALAIAASKKGKPVVTVKPVAQVVHAEPVKRRSKFSSMLGRKNGGAIAAH